MSNSSLPSNIGFSDIEADYAPPTLLYSGPRGIAIRLLSRAESSDAYVEKMIEQELRSDEWSHYDRALFIELVYGTLRWQNRLDWILTGFYHGEFNKCILPVKNAMRVALYQILMLSKVPPMTAISESVAIIKRIKDEKSANVISGVLKNILRNIDGIRYPNKEENLQLFLSVTLSHPLWIVKRWCERYGDETAEKLLTANNERPVIHIRVNKLKSNIDSVTAWLKEHEISNEISTIAPHYFRINGLQNIESTEIYQEGHIAKLDATANLILQLAQVSQGKYIVDLGAVSGMKALACAEEMNNKGKVVAVAKYDEQLRHIEKHSRRLGITCITSVASDPVNFSCSDSPDIIIAEAPSSELGLLQRKPDIKWRTEIDVIRKHNNSQKAMLQNAAKCLKSGGVLIYTIASTEPEETTQIIDWFLQQHPDFIKQDASNFVAQEFCQDGYLITYPHIHKTDGVFAVRFIKQ